MKHLKLLAGISAVIGLCTPASASAKSIEELQPFTTDSFNQDSLIALEQSAADRQRDALRILKEAETIRRENSSGGSNSATPADRNLENRTNNEVDRLRNNFGNDREVRESQERLEQLRQERIRLDREQPRYSPEPYYPGPYSPGSRVVPGVPYNTSPGYSEYDNSGSTVIERSPDFPYRQPGVRPNRDLGTVSVSLGFKDGNLNPAVGYQFKDSPIGIEVGAVFNQDILPPGTLDFSVPASILQQFPTGFDNLGSRNLTPQIGADLLGHFKVASNVSLYGGVGVYFQGRTSIIRSNVTNDNGGLDSFRQTNNTDISVAVSGGADVKIGDSLRIGGGYHSLRGVTAKIGIDF